MSATVAMLDKADALFRKGRFAESNDVLTLAWSTGDRTSFIASCIGRNHRYAGDHARAREWLELSASQEPVFPWVHFERAALYLDMGDALLAGTACEALLDAGSGSAEERGFNHIHVKTLITCAHRCFPGQMQIARRLYDKLFAHGMEDYLVALRVLEARLDAARLAEARVAAQHLQARYSLDAWGNLAVARLAQLDGRIDDAIGLLRNAVALEPGNLFLRRLTCHRLIELDRLELAAEETERLAADEAFPREERDRLVRDLRFRADVRGRQSAAVLARIDSGELDLSALPDWMLLEAIYPLMAYGSDPGPADVTLCGRLAEHLETKAEHSLPAAQAALFFWSASRQLPRAVALLDRLAPTPHYEHPDLVLLRFEIACGASRLDEAGAIYAAHWRGRDLTVSESVWAIRYLMEVKRASEAADVALSLLRRRLVMPEGEYPLLRVARRAARHRDFLALLAAAEPDDDPRWAEFSARLGQLLADDLCVQEGTESVEVPSAAGRFTISAGNAILVKPGEDADAEPAPPRRPSDSVAIFLCTDHSYFFSALTLFASCVATMNLRDRHIEWFLFVGSEVPPRWRRIVLDFAGRIGLSLTVVDERTFVGSAGGLVADYGLFTGGNVLARAAYYRVYAARYLHALGRFRRALYLDTDIICQADLSRLFDFDMQGALLAARPEEISPEVVKAALRCGVEADEYFNSGVLLLDFQKPGTLPRIEETIRVSETETERLTFHDQCALNIGFAQLNTPLPAAYNFFLRPHRRDNGDLDTAVLLHFLDRPKPWDVGFVRDYRAAWLPHAATVRRLLTPADYREVVAVANGAPIENLELPAPGGDATPDAEIPDPVTDGTMQRSAAAA